VRGVAESVLVCSVCFSFERRLATAAAGYRSMGLVASGEWNARFAKGRGV
jgi:hypothetical protein